MFNESWYPTPKSLANEVKRLIDWNEVDSVLDPSAGKGDLITGVMCSEFERYYDKKDDVDAIPLRLDRKVKVYAIEIDPMLRGTLHNYRFLRYYNDAEPDKINVIGSDFFTYAGQYKIDCIIMNPPFSNGDEHLLKALEIMKNGGQIICILNRETIDNAYSKRRKLLATKIKDYGATIIDEGPAFKTAYRKTNVVCVIVKFVIPKIEDIYNFDLTKMKTLREKEFTVDGADDKKFVVSRDIIKASVLCYDKEIELYRECLESIHKLRNYGGGNAFSEIENYKTSLNDFILKATARSWKHLISYPRFTRFMTRKTRKRFFQQVSSQGMMEFTEENVYQFLDALVFSYQDIMTESLIDIFDLLTKYDKLNTSECEGWWTNDAFKVNRRVIIPRIWGYSLGSVGSIEWTMGDILDDIDRIVMWLSGDWLEDANNPTPDTDRRNIYIGGILDTFNKAKIKFNTEHDSHFFKFRVYKKPDVGGTMHLEFKDEQLWQLLNLKAAEKKNWLPDDYKARRKEAMDKGFLIEYK